MTLESVNDVVKNHKNKVENIFVVNIEFWDYDDSREKCTRKLFRVYLNLRVKLSYRTIEAFISFYQQCGLEKR